MLAVVQFMGHFDGNKTSMGTETNVVYPNDLGIIFNVRKTKSTISM